MATGEGKQPTLHTVCTRRGHSARCAPIVPSWSGVFRHDWHQPLHSTTHVKLGLSFAFAEPAKTSSLHITAQGCGDLRVRTASLHDAGTF